jgi:glycosyltransferase involved in cell wall biosynthesis
MRILVATDAFRPQVNGVVRSLESLAKSAPAFGAEIDFLSPQGFPTIPLPTYGEIRLALAGQKAVARRVAQRPVDHIHIATEGPVGLAARRFCLNQRLPFTTSYHTRFPEYIAARTPIPERLTYALLRRFHNAGDGTMVSTPSLARELEGRGFARLMQWSRGVDNIAFNPAKRVAWDLPKPIFLYAGRLAPEKNLEAFLKLKLPGSKVIVGDGPSRHGLSKAYPEAHFLGVRKGEDLCSLYASADVFVFPSKTDTFGMVLLEALASGLPVAAFPVLGPLDVIGDSGAGVLDDDLRAACLRALDIPRDRARAHAETYTWAHATRQFLANIVTAKTAHAARHSSAPGPSETSVVEPSGKKSEFLRQRQTIEP